MENCKEGEEVLKRKLIVFSLFALMLVSCTKKIDKAENQFEDESVNNVGNDPVEETLKTYTADSAKFHLVVDWLTDTQIVFVEKEAGIYFVKSFDIATGNIEILYTESMVIVDVLIHPSKNTFLVHTSDNPSSATIKVISLEGVVQDEITIASSELAIEWNDLDPTLLLLTAFHQDWTYDVFLYSGIEEEMGLIPLGDPFPKWLGKRKVVTVHIPEHPLDGGELYFV